MTTTPYKPFQTLAAVTIGAALMTIGYSAAWAHPMGPDDKTMACAGRDRESINGRLDKAAQELEIKASQQAAWEVYAKAYKELAERPATKPDPDADAAAMARKRAEMVTELAKKLTKIADATAKLQTVLSEDQRKIFDRITRHSRHGGDWRHHGDGDHEWRHDDRGEERHGSDKPQR